MSDSLRRPPNLATGKPAAAGDFVLARRYRVGRPFLPEARRTMLDFGCGNGSQTRLFGADFTTAIGLDIDRDFLTAAGAVSGDAAAVPRPLLFDGGVIPLRDGSVDCVVSFTVLEHVPDQERALREMLRVLKPGGRLLLSVPNKWWVFETHGANLPLLPWNRVPLVSWWPKALHDRYSRARIYRAREIRALVEEAGFRVVETFRMTAPMDVVRWAPLRDLLRATIFGPDRAPLPFLATEIFVVADKPGD